MRQQLFEAAGGLGRRALEDVGDMAVGIELDALAPHGINLRNAGVETSSM